MTVSKPMLKDFKRLTLQESEDLFKTGTLGRNERKVLSRYIKFQRLYNSSASKTFEDDLADKIDRRIEAIFNDDRLTKCQIKVLKIYYKHLMNHTTSIDTRRSYLNYAKLMVIRIGKDFEKITKKDIENFLIDLEKKYKLKPKTILTCKINTKAFFKWFYNFEEKGKYPKIVSWINLTRKNGIKLPEDVLSVKDVKKLIQVSDNVRDKALLFTLYETGARRGEFLRLRIKHLVFDDKGAIILIPQGKTDSRRLRLIECVPDLKKWYEAHPNKEDGESPLWINIGSWFGKALGEDGLKKVIKVIGNKAGISLKKCYPHSFRHCRATELSRQGFNEAQLRIWCGWFPGSSTPSTYIHLAGADIEKTVLEKAGLLDKRETEDILKPKKCVRCGFVNSSTNSLCVKCYMALDLKTVVEQEEKDKKTEKEFKDIFAYALKHPEEKFVNIMDKFRE